MRISDWSSDVCASDLAIAKKAGLPKANVHYYFGTKEALYAAVLEDILGLWLGELDRITEERDPATALGDYIRATLRPSRGRPLARSEEQTSELQSLMRISYDVFCLKKQQLCTYHPHPTHLPCYTY